MADKKWLKIVAPLLILCVVAGIWVFKNNQDKTPSETQEGVEIQPLDMTEVDLEAWKAYGLPIMVDFGGEACGPCQSMRPDLEKVHRHMQGKVTIRYVDVWANPAGAGDIPIQVVPTQVFFNADGTPFEPSEELLQTMGFTLYSFRDTGELAYTVHQGVLSEEDMLTIFREMGVEV